MSSHSKATMARRLRHKVTLPINQAHQLVGLLSWTIDTNGNDDWAITVDCPKGSLNVWLSDDNLARYEGLKDKLDSPMTIEEAMR